MRPIEDSSRAPSLGPLILTCTRDMMTRVPNGEVVKQGALRGESIFCQQIIKQSHLLRMEPKQIIRKPIQRTGSAFFMTSFERLYTFHFD